MAQTPPAGELNLFGGYEPYEPVVPFGARLGAGVRVGAAGRYAASDTETESESEDGRGEEEDVLPEDVPAGHDADAFEARTHPALERHEERVRTIYREDGFDATDMTRRCTLCTHETYPEEDAADTDVRALQGLAVIYESLVISVGVMSANEQVARYWNDKMVNMYRNALGWKNCPPITRSEVDHHYTECGPVVASRLYQDMIRESRAVIRACLAKNLFLVRRTWDRNTPWRQVAPTAHRVLVQERKFLTDTIRHYKQHVAEFSGLAPRRALKRTRTELDPGAKRRHVNPYSQ